MQQAASARAPAHLWIVGLLTLLWNGFGCFDYFMTKTNNQAYLSQMPADAVAYANSLPGFATFFWAIGVWGGLAGAILLLMRSRHAVLAFGVSLVGAVVGLGYQMFMTDMPASMKEGVMGAMPWVIIAVAAFQVWYARNVEKQGLLR
jgi:CHASE2 domain-containing sensor protein